VIADRTAYDVRTLHAAIQTVGWKSRGQYEYLLINGFKQKVCFWCLSAFCG